MDVFYEESAVNANAVKGEKRYKIINVFTVACGIVALICLVLFVYFLIPMLTGTRAGNDEESQQAYATMQAFMLLLAMGLMTFGGLWLFLRAWRKRINVSYDYIFVSGELRVAKIFNVNRRKFLYRIAPESVLQVGDVDGDSYDRIKADPMTKEVVCTPNTSPAKGKFFLYVHAVEGSGRKLFVLECREELLVNILKFVKRGTLAPDYVSQEKKQQR